MPSQQVHRTAIIDPQVQLADDVQIGPNCVLEGNIALGAGTRLIGNVHLVGPLTVGENNLFYPNSCIGFGPQHHKFPLGTPHRGVKIGRDNIFREGCTIHGAIGEQPTTVGNHNMLMCNTHLGHDVVMHNHCTLASAAILGGHVESFDSVILGGCGIVHQFCRLGRMSMLSGLAGLVQDLPPFCTAYETRTISSLNIVGLRRAGYREHIPALREAFSILFRSRHTRAIACERIEKELGSDPLCAELVAFVRASKRGITRYVSSSGESGE